MSDKAFDRTIINTRERPVSSDINQAQATASFAMTLLAQTLFAGRASTASDASAPRTGFTGDGWKVSAHNPVSMQVVVRAGMGFLYDPTDVAVAIGGIAGLDDRSPYKPLYLSTDEVITVPAADPANPRIDIVEVKVDRRAADPTSRDILDPGTGQFVGTSVNKTLTFDAAGRSTVNGAGSINYKTGTPAATPAVPANTPGYTTIAQVGIPALATTIPQNKIADWRQLLVPYNVGVASMRFNMPASGGSVLPSILSYSVPPGCFLVATGVAVAGAACKLTLVAANILQASWVITAEPNGFVANNLQVAQQDGAASVKNANSTDSADVGNAAISAPAVDITSSGAPFNNLWQRISVISVESKHQNNGTTDATVADPTTYTATVVFSY